MRLYSLNLLNFLVSGGFLYPRTPAEPINQRLGYTVRDGIEARDQRKCPRIARLEFRKKKSAVARVAPFFSSCKYLEGFLNRGWTLFCGARVVYKPQLAKASTPCGVVSTREKSVFVLDLLELMGYGRISGTAVEPCPHRVRRNASRPFAGLSPPGCLRLYELTANQRYANVNRLSYHHAGLCRPARETGYRLRFLRISETGTGIYILPW